MITEVEYNTEEHLHRYAVWTAARAQRGAFASNELIKSVINGIKLREKAFRLSFDISEGEFDAWHSNLCNRVSKSSNAEFGRSAKIINIYLKTTLVIPNCNYDYNLIKVIHPPIDGILVRNLSKEGYLPKKYKTVVWSVMKEDVYVEIIKELRKTFAPLWKAEFAWES